MLILPPWFTQQPQYVAPIELSNPISEGLILAVNPATGFVNMVTGKSLTANGTITRPVTGSGIAAATDGSSVSDYIDTSVFNSGDLTVLFLGARMSSATTSGIQKVVDPIHTTITGSEANRWEFNLGNGYGAGVDIDKARFGQLSGGTPANVEAWVDGVEQVGTNPFDAPLINGQIYNIICSANGMPGDANIRLLGGANNSYASNVQVALILAWARKISAAETLSVSLNPWQVFSAGSRRLFALAAAAIYRRALYLKYG